MLKIRELTITDQKLNYVFFDLDVDRFSLRKWGWIHEVRKCIAICQTGLYPDTFIFIDTGQAIPSQFSTVIAALIACKRESFDKKKNNKA
jgi:hypothetical protein